MFSITPSHIIEHLFCPRYTYFEYVLAIPEYQEKYYKVEKGRDVHQDKATINKDYLRKKIGAVEKWQNQYLTNDILRGEIDEVLLLNNNTMAPLDYKFATYPGTVYDTYKTQLFCYALLIEENFGKPVEKGFLIYVRSKNQLVEIPITQADKNKIRIIANEIMHIIETNFYPKATPFKKRCADCTYKNICTR